MRLTVLVIVYLICSTYLSGQCNRTVKVVFTSINYKTGCDFADGGGIDPSLDLFDTTGDRIYNSYYDDQSQVTGPQDNVPIDFNISVNECGNFSNSFTLGTFPIDVESYEVTADTYEKSSNFLNNQCSTFNILFDAEYSTGTHTFDFLETNGTLDVGGCMTYNYELEIKYDGLLTLDFLGPICATDTLFISNNSYHKDNPRETFMVPGLADFCDTVFNIDLSFYDAIDLQIDGPAATCAGQIQELTLNQPFLSYLWNDGSTLPILTIDSAGFYTVTVTSTNGCTKVSEIDIADLPSPSLSIQGDIAFCAETNNQLIVMEGGNSSVWSTGETTDTITVTEAGVYIVTLTDINGCSSIDSVEVFEISPPEPFLIGIDSFCKGDSTLIELTENYDSYLWNDLSQQSSLIVTSEGDYMITVTDVNGCTAATSISVQENNLPTPTLSGTNNICAGMPIPLSVNENYLSYLWNNGETSNTILADSAGDYTVTVTDNNGCTSSTTQVVTESDQLNPSITGKIEICEGETNSISVLENQLNYLWQDGSTEQERIASTAGIYSVTVTDNNGCSGSSSVTVVVIPQNITQIESVTCYPDSVGTEEVIVPNPNGCDDIIIYNLALEIEQLCGIGYCAKYSFESCTGSKDGNYLLEILDAYYPVLAELYDSDGNNILSTVYNENDSNLNITDLSQGDYALILTADNGHIENVTIEMKVASNPLTEIPASIIADIGETISLEATLDLSLYESYYWSLDGTSLCSNNCNSYVFTADESTIYEFYAKLENTNCEFLVQTEIVVNPPRDLYIPTVFALSETGENEKFCISGPGTIFITSLSIYDRWGNLIRQTDGSDPTWDGTFNGRRLNSGAYIYKLEIQEPTSTSDAEYKSGIFTLLR